MPKLRELHNFSPVITNIEHVLSRLQEDDARCTDRHQELRGMWYTESAYGYKRVRSPHNKSELSQVITDVMHEVLGPEMGELASW